ncbi:MAG: arylesterase [Gemmatimonadales bacterium]|nr:arylesterase [Gemmatimonadales bacterium]
MIPATVAAAAAAAVLVLGACGGGGGADGRTGGRAVMGSGGANVGAIADSSSAGQPVRSSAPARPRLVFLGTSLTAGLGLDPSQAYPAVIQEKLDSAGLAWEAVNAGVSGETSAGALRRIDWVLREPAAVLVVETGANDGLRGQDIDSLAANLQAILDHAKRQVPAPKLVVVGMEALPNMGRAYGQRFRAVFPEVARRNGATYLPFLLEGVAGVDSLNQADGIHPTAAGQRLVAAHVWKVLGPVLQGR